jgi:LysR family glycine cleavage system transcriptional activator
MIGAALSGQGVAMGIGRLVSGLLQEGRLVAPFSKSIVGERAYYVICSSLTATRPHVQAFVDWLIAEAKTVAIAQAPMGLSSPPPAAKSTAARPRARSGR